MTLRSVQRHPIRMRLSLQGASGSGRTYSALQLAYGLCGDWQRVALIHTGHAASYLYAHLGAFQTITLRPPYHTDRFCEALDLCERSAMEVIIVDSASAAWSGEGGWLDQYAAIRSDNPKGWRTLRPEHYAFMTALHEVAAHLIVTLKASESAMAEQEKGFLDDFITVLALDREYRAQVLKDKTGQLDRDTPFLPSVAIGQQLQRWCQQGTPVVSPELQASIDGCSTMVELYSLLLSLEVEDLEVIHAFSQRRQALEAQGKGRRVQSGAKGHGITKEPTTSGILVDISTPPAS